MTGPHGDENLLEHLRRVLGVDTLPDIDPTTKRINDQARDIPDWLQIKANLGSEY